MAKSLVCTPGFTHVRGCDNIAGRASEKQVEQVTTSMSRLSDMLLHVVISENLFQVLDTTGVWQVEVKIEVSCHEDIFTYNSQVTIYCNRE